MLLKNSFNCESSNLFMLSFAKNAKKDKQEKRGA